MAEYIKHEMSEKMHGGRSEKMHGGRAFYRLATYSNFSMEDFIDFMRRNEGMKESQVRAVVAGLTEQLAQMLSIGHTVSIDGLGTFRISLGVKPNKEIGAFDTDESQRNAESICVRNVLFKADRGFVKMVNEMTKLERGGECRICRPSTTRDERLAMLLTWLESHAYAHIADYMRMTGLNRNAATRELRALRNDPASGIKTQGRGSHKVYVRG